MENLNLNLENLKYKTGENKVIKFEIDSKFKGTLSLKDLIVYKTNNEIKVYDRVCDHAGGRLITNNNGELKKMINLQNNGIFIPNYKRESLSVFRKLIEDKQYLNKLKINAYKSYENQFNFDKVFENIIEKLIN